MELLQAQDGPSEDIVFDQVQRPPLRPQPRMATNNATYWSRYYEAAGREYVIPGNYSSRK